MKWFIYIDGRYSDDYLCRIFFTNVSEKPNEIISLNTKFRCLYARPIFVLPSRFLLPQQHHRRVSCNGSSNRSDNSYHCRGWYGRERLHCEKTGEDYRYVAEQDNYELFQGRGLSLLYTSAHYFRATEAP